MFHTVSRVAESSTSTGTGDFTLSAALSGYIRANQIPNITVNDFFDYLIEAVDSSGVPTGDWEAGIGTYSAANTLNRTIVTESSNSGSAVNFGSGTKYVYLSPISLRFGLNRSRWMFYETDFLGPSGAATLEAASMIWDVALIGAGTQVKIAGTAGHPGQWRPSSSTTANSGAYVMSDVTAFSIEGGESGEFIINPQTNSNTTIRAGHHNATTATAPTNGVFFEIVNGAVVGICRNANTQTATSTLATLSTSTWYRLRYRVNLAKTEALFQVFSETGTLLGSGTVTTNIPTAANTVGHGLIATNSGTTAVTLVIVDYMSLASLRRLTR
jgi:hypothetical protein